MNQTLYLFLDTNIYLHAHFFDQIPWPKIAEVDEVVLVVPLVALEELDDKKHSGRTKRIRSRAQKTTSRMLEILSAGGDVREQTRLTDFQDLPDVQWGAVKLDSQKNDHRLLATILTFRSANPNQSIAFMTRDAGPALIARRLDIPTIELPEKYLLDPELDETEKELRKAKTELAQMHAAQPKLTLTFGHGSNRLELERPRIPSEEKMLEEIEAHHRQYSLEDSDPAAIVGAAAASFLASSDEIRRYKKQLPDYLDRWEKWYRRKVRRDATTTIDFLLLLRNEGRQPATSVYADLSFPAGLIVTESPVDGEDEPEPDPPLRPRTTIEMISLQAQSISAFAGYQPPLIGQHRGFMAPEVQMWAPEITGDPDEGMRVHLSVGKVQHGAPPAALDQLYVSASEDPPDSFGVGYMIRCDELHEPVSGQLHVVFR